MKALWSEHKFNFIGIGIFLVCLTVLASTKVVLARILPNCDSLKIIRCNIANEDYAFGYCGEEIKPEIERIVLLDEEGNTHIKYSDEFSVLSYANNIEVGSADIELAVEGYKGSIWVLNAFSIFPDAVSGFKMTSADAGMIEVVWEPVIDADGYYLYRTSDGINYALIKEFSANENLIYQDTEIDTNCIYTYKVKAFQYVKEKVVLGFDSETIQYNTPLATPTITAVKNITYHSLQVQWSRIDGAVGYKVYHSLFEDGEFECVADIVSGDVTSFLDAKCESVVPNYYYVKACQKIDNQEIWGIASAVVSGKTTPNRVGISASGTETEVTLSWKVSTGAHGYEIYRSNNGSPYVLVDTLDGAEQTSWSQSGLDKHSSYIYRIRPYCVFNEQTIYGPYSGTYEKEAIIVFDYSGEMGMDILRQYVGRPYVYGGSSPTKGWDCSYFVKWTFETHFGVELPRTAAQQSAYGVTVDKNDRTTWQPGDLIFYRDKNGKGSVAHVAVYLGNGQMIHALSKKRGTLIQSVDQYETWDENKLYCVKRIFDNN